MECCFWIKLYLMAPFFPPPGLRTAEPVQAAEGGRETERKQVEERVTTAMEGWDGFP